MMVCSACNKKIGYHAPVRTDKSDKPASIFCYTVHRPASAVKL